MRAQPSSRLHHCQHLPGDRVNQSDCWARPSLPLPLPHLSLSSVLTRSPLDVLAGPQQPVTQPSARGLKRSRSPDNSYGDLQAGEEEDGTLIRAHAAGRCRACAPACLVVSIANEICRRRQAQKARPCQRTQRQRKWVATSPDSILQCTRPTGANSTDTDVAEPACLSTSSVAISQANAHKVCPNQGFAHG